MVSTSSTGSNTTAAEFPPPSLVKVAEQVSALLKARGEKVCVAETACGGLISSTLLSLPGASQIYAGGLTLYTLESRIAFADWTQKDISSYAGPTKTIVLELARAALRKLSSVGSGSGSSSGSGNGSKGSLVRWALGESGTAGPTRSGEGKNRTPGYVALAVVCTPPNYDSEALPGHKTAWMIERETGSADRQENMVRFAFEALDLLRQCILEVQDPGA